MTLEQRVKAALAEFDTLDGVGIALVQTRDALNQASKVPRPRRTRAWIVLSVCAVVVGFSVWWLDSVLPLAVLGIFPRIGDSAE